MGKVAIITQSYKNDYKECRLLCESIDRFAPNMDHYIFVNDEDVELFQTLNYNGHHVYGKSTILPHFMFRLPWRILGHHFHVSPFTMPVREWIVQQICKLGVFEVIGNEYDAVFNIDSESIFMRPLDLSNWIKGGRYLMYHVDNSLMNEPGHNDYITAAQKLLKIADNTPDIARYDFMSTPTCFVRDNITKLLYDIKSNYWLKSWKLALCNTYRFSENYTYGIYTKYMLNNDNHFYVDYRTFTTIDLPSCKNADFLRSEIERIMTDSRIAGVLLQKRDRKHLSDSYLDFETREKIVKNYWDKQQH